MNKPKHSVSQLDFRISLESCKKIELITKSARRREEDTETREGKDCCKPKGVRIRERCINLNSKINFNTNTKAHKDYFIRANQEKRKFIHLIDKNTISHIEEKAVGYATESVKLIRN
jgi:hypothetical protein